MGTRFVASTECTAHEAYKNAIIKAGDRDAVVTGGQRASGRNRNSLTRTLDELEKRGPPGGNRNWLPEVVKRSWMVT